jgi:hypothetical protein
VRAFRAALVLLVWPAFVLAAGYPRYGGTLRIAASTVGPPLPPLLADSPSEAALRALEVAPVCGLSE